MAARLGFESTDLTVIATAISELARNILEYAQSGEIGLGVAQRGSRLGIVVIARDEGPGIPDVARALQDGFTTGKGLGLGGGSGPGDGEERRGIAAIPDAGPTRCAIRLSAAGITVEGKAATQAEAIAACKATTGADVLVTGDARQGDWDDLRAALEAAGIAYFTREPRGVTAPDAGGAPAPDTGG